MAYVVVTLDEFSDEEILRELRNRRLDEEKYAVNPLVQQLFEAARNNQDTQPIIKELVWETIGRIL